MCPEKLLELYLCPPIRKRFSHTSHPQRVPRFRFDRTFLSRVTFALRRTHSRNFKKTKKYWPQMMANFSLMRFHWSLCFTACFPKLKTAFRKKSTNPILFLVLFCFPLRNLSLIVFRHLILWVFLIFLHFRRSYPLGFSWTRVFSRNYTVHIFVCIEYIFGSFRVKLALVDLRGLWGRCTV